ncbi:hypothetical protein OTU49_014229 [Cherax quadricarinatus]|uniref:K Homology domain-containing protein n=1 Tax=Cherax quadricarinatus TaxID=27406 RepID=A0AAW0VS28_CHEQU|nr:uncharacterized protein LOC128700704 isoform X2 [Cherax quadricarinatus]
MTDEWICRFQVMQPSPEMIPPENNNSSCYITSTCVVKKIDDYMKKFIDKYNRECCLVWPQSNPVLLLSGAKYVYHFNPSIIVGVVVLKTLSKSKSLSLNGHLRLYKKRPLQPPDFELFHKIYFEDAYSINVTDEDESENQFVRDLFNSWVDDEFYNSLHWIISPSVDHHYNTQVLNQFTTLLHTMQESLENSNQSRCETLEAVYPVPSTSSPKKRKRGGEVTATKNKIWRYSVIRANQKINLKAFSWEENIPLDEYNRPKINQYRFSQYVIGKGGTVIKEISNS